MAERQRRKMVRTQLPQTYVFRIERVRPSYSFSVGHLRLNEGDFTDYNQTEIEATCLVPPKHFGRITKLIFLGDRRILDRMQSRAPPGDYIPGVGTLTMRQDRCEYLGTLPSDAAFSIPVLALVQGLKYVYLSGEASRVGSARITFMSFSSEFDPDDY